MALLKEWRDVAYNEKANKGDLQRFWANYFETEKNIYIRLLSNPEEEYKGTVKELAERLGLDVFTMTGFLDGINDSLVTPNPTRDGGRHRSQPDLRQREIIQEHGGCQGRLAVSASPVG